MILGVTLKSIMLKFLSIFYLNPTGPALSKTFQDFWFFCDVNQTVPVASTVFVKYRRQKRAEAAKVNVGVNVPIRFYPLIAVFLLDLEALRNNFYLGNLDLPFFSIKKVKKKNT